MSNCKVEFDILQLLSRLQTCAWIRVELEHVLGLNESTGLVHAVGSFDDPINKGFITEENIDCTSAAGNKKITDVLSSLNLQTASHRLSPILHRHIHSIQDMRLTYLCSIVCVCVIIITSILVVNVYYKQLCQQNGIFRLNWLKLPSDQSDPI